MPVTFTVADHPANEVNAADCYLKDGVHLLASTWGKGSRLRLIKELLQSTFSDKEYDFSKIVPNRNGFMNTIISAYNEHRHLILRPDDVWMAILGQLNFYINAHGEELRDRFVAHEGKKELTVVAFGDRYSVNFGDLARQMTDLIDENVVDKSLKDWILPNFSTTTDNDVVVSSVLMMATLKSYFSYTFALRCGIPSVTLEGEKSDWEKVLNRIDRLASFGDEPKAWAKLLRPILSRFVSAFDGAPDIDFWSKVCHYQGGGSGPSYICGWVTAFAVWSKEGTWQGPSLRPQRENPIIPRSLYHLKLDDAQFGLLDTSKIPPGYCEVDVRLDDNGEIFDCMMVAGHLGTWKRGENGDTTSPLSAWFMFIKEDQPTREHGPIT